MMSEEQEIRQLERMDREMENSLERLHERRTCQRCVCYDGRRCDVADEEKAPDDSCTEFEAWS